ncbi:hypothetical protein Niako_3866 [Niastella koreensis GR20-10]|uniref:Uncharacterized protein n=1 Tax=Niastella koreensis (strain DSM 17620 / KACC 11465 / NBRC 106392 / GR20-10) TaxID=700598 RepID=G8T8I2_NIAKG|nr:hypothetical protein Niako_3866 [Niastella koreensis GR20-10]
MPFTKMFNPYVWSAISWRYKGRMTKGKVVHQRFFSRNMEKNPTFLSRSALKRCVINATIIAYSGNKHHRLLL